MLLACNLHARVHSQAMLETTMSALKSKVIAMTVTAACSLGASLSTWAVPTLQVGVPCATPISCGVYGDYSGSSSAPSEADTALTSGGTLLVGGAFGPNTVKLGGRYSGEENYSSFLSGGLTAFDGIDGAILMATVGGVGSITVNNLASIYSTAVNNVFPNNHAPLGDGENFYFFNIGNFSDIADQVDDFADEGQNLADGEVKSLSLQISGFDWVHFDVFALETNKQGQTEFRTTLSNNPGSHDVTWKDEGGGDDDEVIPEPGTIALAGLALLGLAATRRRSVRA
jgi:PEP-CTERM motif